jgi:hypothetical protein
LFTYLRLACCFLCSALRPRCDVALENLALRQQLVVLARSCRRPRLTPADRLFWTLALAVLVALALRARPRPARHGRPLAPQVLAPLLDLEEPPLPPSGTPAPS